MASDITNKDLEAPEMVCLTSVTCQTEEIKYTICQLRSELLTSQDKITSVELALALQTVVPFGKRAMEAASEGLIIHYTGLPNLNY